VIEKYGRNIRNVPLEKIIAMGRFTTKNLEEKN
jgi:hypothetical protein